MILNKKSPIIIGYLFNKSSLKIILVNKLINQSGLNKNKQVEKNYRINRFHLYYNNRNCNVMHVVNVIIKEGST